ncbi:MAG: HAD-IIB family hydrolase [Gemmataceae bacterium]|nr:HAD-IIB family hydrolase [Gemmataceae bacterium]
MRYYALAADYDGTLAHDGLVDDPTWAALTRLKASGRKLLIVSGRELDELLGIIGEKAELFDRIVAENGAVVYHPDTKEVRTIGPPPPERFVAELRKRMGIAGDPDRLAPHGPRLLAVGRVIVATWEPHQHTVLGVIQDLGLEMQVIFNKGAVMVLPSGVNKATGLAAALADLGLSAHNVVGVGDAENDHAFLSMCECGAAVANALPAVKETADVVTRADHGAGVAELVEHLLADDLAAAAPKLARHHVPLGKRADGAAEAIDPHAAGVMVCGTSGSGKSTLTTGLLERLAAAGYQLVVIDPEGDYASLEFAVVLGSPDRAPLVAEVVDVLRDPARNAVVNLLGVALGHRPGFFAELLPALLDLRARTGRPHWLVVDEAHHLLPAGWEPAGQTVPAQLRGMLSITVHPGSVSPAVLGNIDTVLAVGGTPHQTIAEFCTAAGANRPKVDEVDRLPSGDAVLWRVGAGEAVRVTTEPPKTERKRHSRKYAEGNLGPDRSFYFRGPEGKLNLKAHNLLLFLQMADGVDDETWDHHLRKHDYSRWMKDQVKDEELAAEVEQAEANTTLAPPESKAAVRAAVEGRYTLPADKPSGIID